MPVIEHLRKDVEIIDEPKAQALFETSAEVLSALVRTLDHYEQKTERAWAEPGKSLPGVADLRTA